MSSVQLLDKTRKIGKLLHNNNSSKVVFNDICKVLCEILSSNVLVISKKGKVLGVGDAPGVDSITELIVDQVGGFIDALHIFINADLISTVPRGKWKSGVSAGWKIIGIGHIIWSGNLQLHGLVFSVPGCHHIAILCMGGIQ